MGFVLRAFDCKVPSVYIKAYQTAVLPSLLYGSEIWRPWLKRDLKSLDRFQSYFVKRVAFKCGIDRNSIVFAPLSEILDSKDLKLAHLLRNNADFADFFVTRTTNIRSSILFITPVARKNVV